MKFRDMSGISDWEKCRYFGDDDKDRLGAEILLRQPIRHFFVTKNGECDSSACVTAFQA